MATFTMTLKECWAQNRDIGLFHYPIFKESYRPTLNKKIMDHYWNREIGMETVNLFTFAVKRKMNEIMPYYNQLYSSELLKIDPLLTMDITNESTGETEANVTGSAESNNQSDSKSRSVQSDFPQHRLAGNEDYASTAADATSNSTATADSTESSKTDATSQNRSRTTGIQGNQSDMLTRYRETFLNIDLMVIDELSDCFMSVWNTSDAYTQNSFGPYRFGIGW